MYQFPFTAAEEWEYKELSFQRDREGQLDFLKNGIPMTARHKEWLEQERLRVLGQSYSPQHMQALPCPEEYAPRVRTLPSSPTQVANPISTSLGESSSSASNDGNGKGSRSIQETQLQESAPKPSPIKQRDSRCDIQMHGKGGWKALKAILDTGTEENWISQKIVDRLGLPVKKGLVTKWTTFDGREINSGSAVDPTWCVESSSNTHQTRFHIAPKEAPFEVLFGNNIIDSGEVQFAESYNPIQVLASSKISKEEQKRIEENEALMKDKQAKLSSQTQEVKRSSNQSKKTSKSSTQSSKDSRGKKDKR